MKSPKRKVISASRREEMPGFAPQRLTKTLHEKCPPERVHTLVLWTKNPLPALDHMLLKETLSRYDQIFIHLTITGMGRTPLEPGIPETENVLRILPELVDLVKSPDRIFVRFDPIIHIKLPNDTVYTNFPHFAEIASAAKQHGINRVIVSWMSFYPKVMRRLEYLGIKSEQLTRSEWSKECEKLQQTAGQTGIELRGCCVPGMERSACIDGAMFSTFHPKRYFASQKRAGGQREHCGCTESWDIGWYYPCAGGCVYCYANPKIVVVRQDFNDWNPEKN